MLPLFVHLDAAFGFDSSRVSDIEVRVIVTGANGQLGNCLRKTQPQTHEVIALDVPDIDFSKPHLIGQQLAAYSGDVLINAAAYTAVDAAEENQELAYKINAEAVASLAKYCQQKDMRFIHISTDFVFSGKQSIPYAPEDLCEPLGVYGASKYQGEQLALEHCDNTTIIRTAWLYSEFCANFVKTMLSLAETRSELNVVADQIGTPTYAGNLAKQIWNMVDQPPRHSIYHYSDAGVASWYDFAWTIFEMAAGHRPQFARPNVKPIASVDYKTLAQRPYYSVLDKRQICEEYDAELQQWRIPLNMVVAELLSQA